MKAALLVMLGVCGGALAAWFVLDDTLRVGYGPALSANANDESGRVIGRQDPEIVSGAADNLTMFQSLSFRALTAPRNAFEEAMTLDDSSLRTRALHDIAKTWARQSPQDALAHAAGLPEDLRSLIESAVAEEWAFVDPAGFLAYAESITSIDQIIAGLNVLLATDPERVWVVADRHDGPGDPGATELYLSAVRAMAGRDPIGTVARFQSLATGQQRDPILTSIATGFADADPEAALAWVMAVHPFSPEAASTVLRTIAVEDPIRAYDALRESAGAGLSIDSLRWILAAAVLEGQQDTASIATALVERYDSAFSDPLVSALLNFWVRQSGDAAMAWLSTNRGNVTAESVTTMVSNLALDDVWLAASLADRVPPEFQFQWLTQTANRYGQFDPEAAIEWITQFDGRQDYDQLVNQMVMGAGAGNPQFAAEFIESSGGTVDDSTISFTGNFFARIDPRAAADWALRLADAGRSTVAIEGVATSWVLSDPAAAQQWAFETPRGKSRDEIIETLFEQGTRIPLDYERLIAGYSSEAVADRSIADYVQRVARQPSFFGDAGIERAEQMIGFIGDLDLRREAEERIAEAK